jgi:glycosyltransferase involved in cell wall biosynthesis
MKDSKNILQFLKFSAPYPGNFMQSLIKLDEVAKKAGVNTVYLFCTDTSQVGWMQEFMKDHKNVYFLSGSYFKDVSLVKQIMKQHQVKYVHTHFTTAKHNSLIKVANFSYGAKLFTINHLHNHQPVEGILKATIKNLMTHTDLYIGCSQSVAEDYKKTHPQLSNKTTFVTNGIEFTRLDTTAKLDRKDFQIPANAKIFLMFGFDYHRKGVDVLLEAMKNLRVKGEEVYLLISLSRNKEKLAETIKQNFGELPSWLKIVEAREDVGTYFKFADCFVSASREEGLATSLVEAVYCGCPIITSNIPGPNSLGIPYTYTFESEDVAGLQKQMEAVMALSDAETKNITAEQKAHAVKTFGIDVWAEKIFATYKNLDS